MRILLLFVVVLNGVYAAWEYWRPADRDDVPPPMVAYLKTLELLNENKITALKSVDVEVVQSPVDDVDSQAVTGVQQPVLNSNENIVCYTLGPFKDRNIMQQIKGSIAEHVKDISVRKRQEIEKHRYWVRIPAQSSRKQAKLMASSLRGKGINDFYIVISGKVENSLSLGHFRDPKYANRRMKQVAKLGFETGVDIIYREYDLYWLDYQVEKTLGEAGFSVDEYVSDGVSRLIRECNGSDDG